MLVYKQLSLGFHCMEAIGKATVGQAFAGWGSCGQLEVTAVIVDQLHGSP